jgi:hypothetical protein
MLASRINRLTTDLVDDNRWIYPFKGGDAALRETIVELNMLGDELEDLYAPHFPPNAPEDDPIYVLLRIGKCFKGPSELCANDTYYEDVGYRQTVATSGIDIQFGFLMSAARQFLEETTYTEESRFFQFIDRITDHLRDIIDLVLDEYGVIIKDEAKNTIAVLLSLNALILSTFLLHGILGTTIETKF